MRIPSPLFVTLFLLGLSALPLGAQEFRLSTGKIWTDHQLLREPVGFGAHLGIPFGSRTRLWLGYEHYQSRFSSQGSLCVGFLPPDAHCPQEALREQGRVRSVGVAAPLVVLGGSGAGLALVPGLRVTRVSSDRRSLESNEVLSAGETLGGAELGLEGVLPLFALPLRLHGSAAVGMLLPLLPERVMDGYTPFESGMSWKRAEVGFSFTTHSRRK